MPTLLRCCYWGTQKRKQRTVHSRSLLSVWIRSQLDPVSRPWLNQPIDKIPSGPQLDALSAQKSSAGIAFMRMMVSFTVKDRINSVTGGQPRYLPIQPEPFMRIQSRNAYETAWSVGSIPERTLELPTPKMFLLSGPPRINVAGLRSKRWDGTARFFG